MDYFQCKECEQISSENEIRFGKVDKKCPYCGIIDEVNIWPSAEIRELIKVVNNYNQNSIEYGFIASVFISTALEILLEQLLYIMAIENLSYDEADHLVSIILDFNQGRSRRLTLYKRLGFDSFETEVSKMGYKGFLVEWDKIAETRNKCVHGDLSEAKNVNSVLVESIMNNGLEVFRKLHNDYNKSTNRYRYAAKGK